MKIISKSSDTFTIKDVRTGVDKKERSWYMVKLENADGRINLFCSEYNFDKFSNAVGERVYIITEYSESYSKKNDRTYTSYMLKDIENA